MRKRSTQIFCSQFQYLSEAKPGDRKSHGIADEPGPAERYQEGKLRVTISCLYRNIQDEYGLDNLLKIKNMFARYLSYTNFANSRQLPG